MNSVPLLLPITILAARGHVVRRFNEARYEALYHSFAVVTLSSLLHVQVSGVVSAGLHTSKLPRWVQLLGMTDSLSTWVNSLGQLDRLVRANDLIDFTGPSLSLFALGLSSLHIRKTGTTPHKALLLRHVPWVPGVVSLALS